MADTLSIRLDEELVALLETVSKQTGRAKSDLVRDALRRQLHIESFQSLRNRVLPFAEAQGLLTDDDAWRLIS